MDSSCVLRTENLKKSFGGNVVLNGVNLTLKKGKVYGLIGKNGAGKTTLMRLICGLSFPTSGSIELFGKTEGKEYIKELSKVGVLIEYPSLYGKMSAKENLQLNRIIRGESTKQSDDEILKMVGLGDVGKKPVKDFSLGMRQRLGIAIAVLSDPELLILDEPVNGLDPVGVTEIRELIKQLNTQCGITIIISSHNLPELFQTATDYIIIDKGNVKKCLSQEELEKQCQQFIEIECDDVDKLVHIAKEQLNIKKCEVVSKNMVRLYNCKDKAQVISVMHDSGIIISNLSTKEETLESYFLSVIGGNENA